jgi:transcriptional regulator with XRE-family HTH domain
MDLNSSKTRREVGKLLQKARGKRHFSQKKLAARSGISQSRICRLEAGKAPLDQEILLRLADGLETTIDALLPSWLKRMRRLPA